MDESTYDDDYEHGQRDARKWIAIASPGEVIELHEHAMAGSFIIDSHRDPEHSLLRFYSEPDGAACSAIRIEQGEDEESYWSGFLDAIETHRWNFPRPHLFGPLD